MDTMWTRMQAGKAAPGCDAKQEGRGIGGKTETGEGTGGAFGNEEFRSLVLGIMPVLLVV